MVEFKSLSILHVDMDAFFAAVEVLDNPDLAGKPLLVGGMGKRGVVSTASYEARKFGCHSAQPMSVALRKCPDAIVVPPRGERYREFSEQVFKIFSDYTPLVEPISVDEAFLDLHGTERLFGTAPQVAAEIKKRIHQETRLTGSVGVAPNKFLAKLSSDLEKPDGLTIMDEAMFETVFPKLPISKIWGLGRSTLKHFEGVGVRTMGDLRKLSKEWLVKRFGVSGEAFYNLCRGIDDRRVTPDHFAKSIGQEQTFHEDIPDPLTVRHYLLGEVEQVGYRLRKNGLKAKKVTVKIRYGDFETITRGITLARPTDSTHDLWEAAKELFDHWADSSFRPVRLIGATSSQFDDEDAQMEMFPDLSAEKRRLMEKGADAILERFGKNAIRRGASIKRGEPHYTDRRKKTE
ncbi:MAG: DNA polymerase IV [Candidatus Omnitrophica bacterium]|nr:DNA polymerase IV [Candidatus Omnitrophota bacterium]